MHAALTSCGSAGFTRCGVAPQVAAVHEELGGVREDARGLRQSVDAALAGVREQVVAVVAELSEVRGHSAEVARLAGDVDGVRATLKEEARNAAVRHAQLAALNHGPPPTDWRCWCVLVLVCVGVGAPEPRAGREERCRVVRGRAAAVADGCWVLAVGAGVSVRYRLPCHATSRMHATISLPACVLTPQPLYQLLCMTDGKTTRQPPPRWRKTWRCWLRTPPLRKRGLRATRTRWDNNVHATPGRLLL